VIQLSKRILAVLALSALALPLPAPAADEAADDAKPLHHTNAFVCKRCHIEIFRSWEKSMHANSSALNPDLSAFRASVAWP
jgi:hypothetical protein